MVPDFKYNIGMSIFWKRQETDQTITYRSKMKIWNMYAIPLSFIVLAIISANFGLNAVSGIFIILFVMFCLTSGIDGMLSVTRETTKLSGGFSLFPRTKVSRQNINGYSEVTLEK